MEYKLENDLDLWKKMSPETRKQALEYLRKMESEDRILVEEEDGTEIGMPVSMFEASMKKKPK